MVTYSLEGERFLASEALAAYLAKVQEQIILVIPELVLLAPMLPYLVAKPLSEELVGQ
jgi:hypothetical protein